MKVARLVETGKPLEVGTADKPVPGPKEVLVKVAACGVVPNTKNVLNGGQEGILPKLPCIFGLDAAGTIEAVGSNVLNLGVGQRVYVNPHLTCDTCHQCRRGEKALCYHGALRGYFGFTEASADVLNQYPIGGFSEYVLAQDSKIALLPDAISFPLGARLGYIGTSFGGLKKGGVGPGKTVLINGVTGTLGVSAVAIALGFGAVKILGIGRNKDKLAKVEQMSPLKGRISIRSSEDEGDLVEWIKIQTNGLGVDALYDCLGVGGDADTTSQLIKGAVKLGGKAILAAGGAQGEIKRKYFEAMMTNIGILGQQWFTDAEADELISLIGAGVIDFSFLEHREFALDEVNAAVDAAADRPGGAVNVVVLPGGK